MARRLKRKARRRREPQAKPWRYEERPTQARLCPPADGKALLAFRTTR